jgi:hypothetical protein
VVSLAELGFVTATLAPSPSSNRKFQIIRRASLPSEYNSYVIFGGATKRQRVAILLLIVVATAMLAGRSIALRSMPPPRELDRVSARLNAPIDAVRVESTPLSDVVAVLREKTGANIVIDRSELAQREISTTTPITMRLDHATLETVLTHLSRATDQNVDYGIGDDGVIVISTRALAAEIVVLRFYDVSDIIEMSFQSTAREGARWPASTQEIIGTMRRERAPYFPSHQELIDSLVNVITGTVAPEQWRVNGGTGGCIRELSGVLIVSVGLRQQEQIRQFLEQIRAVLRDRESRAQHSSTLRDSTSQ